MVVNKLALLISTLLEAKVRFLVVGGVAVVAHGDARATVDADLMLDLEELNVIAALEVLRDLGYAPRVPVGALDFAKAALRNRWREEKNMVAFTMINPDHQFPNVHLFTYMPSDFAGESRRAKHFVADKGVRVPVVSLDALIEMKAKIGRAKDALDITTLRQIFESTERS